MVNIDTILHNCHKNSQLLIIVTISHNCHNYSRFSKLSQQPCHNCRLSKLVTVAKIGQNSQGASIQQVHKIFGIFAPLPPPGTHFTQPISLSYAEISNFFNPPSPLSMYVLNGSPLTMDYNCHNYLQLFTILQSQLLFVTIGKFRIAIIGHYSNELSKL